MGWLPDVKSELEELAKQQAKRQIADTNARAITPEQAANVAKMFRFHPWLSKDPGVAISAGRAGLDPLADEVMQASAEVIRGRANTVLGYSGKNAFLNPKQITPSMAQRAIEKINEKRWDAVTEEEAQALVADRGALGGLDFGAGAPGDVLTRATRLAEGRSGSAVARFARDNPVTDNVLEPAARHTATGENPFARGVRATTRTATAAMQGPQQAIQSQFRTSLENIQEHGVVEGALRSNPMDPRHAARLGSQTDIGLMTGTLAKTGELDTGSGFFTGGQVVEDRRQNEVHFGGTLSNGQVVTIGRSAADVFFEPGSKNFNMLSGAIDGGVAIGADSLSIDAIGKARRAAKAFRTPTGVTTATTPTGRAAENMVGLIRGTRNTYSPQLVDSYLTSRHGRNMVQRIADETSITRLDAMFDHKLEPHLLKQFLDETDPDAITTTMRNYLGIGIPQAPKNNKLAMMGFDLKDSMPSRAQRILAKMPARDFYDLEDGRSSVTQIQRTLVNTNAPTDVVEQFTVKMAAASTVQERKNVYFEMFGDIADRAAELHGIDPKESRRLVKLFKDQQDDVRHYFVGSIGEDRNVLGVMVNGTVNPTPTPHLMSEMVDRFLPTPDQRALRRTFTDPATRWILSKADGDMRRPLAWTHAFQERIWKPLVLGRPAWTVRVLGEEQARIAADGLSSLGSHPASYISFMLTDRNKVGRMMEKLGVQGRAQSDVFGGILAESDEFSRAMYRTSGGFLDDEMRLKNHVLFNRGDDGFFDAAADELGTLANDDVARMVARTAGGVDPRAGAIDVGADALETGTRAIGTGENLLLQAQDYFWNDMLYARKQLHGENRILDVLNSRRDADKYIETVLERINIKTGRNEVLLDAVRTGRLDGVPLYQQGTPFISKDAAKKLEEFDAVLPDKLRGPQIIRARRGGRENFQGLGSATDALMSGLMSKPANYLSRSPVFKQKYVDELIAMSPRLDPADVEDMLRGAEKMNLSSQDMKTLRAVAGTAPGDGPMPLAALDELSKGHALDHVQELLYDLSDRSQFFDVFRLIFPFGEAWGEMVTRWTKLLSQSPRPALTVKRMLEAGRNPDVAAIVGQDQAFIHKNAFGDEVVSYPWSDQALKALGGLPGVPGMPEGIPFAGRLAGFSLMTEILPGVGPFAQWPLAVVIPDSPEWDVVNDFLFPYGRPTNLTDPLSFIDELMPSWLRTLTRGASEGGITAEGQRIYQNEMMNVAAWLQASGEFDIAGNPDSAAELTRLADKARDITTWMAVIRGMAQSTAPSSPMYEWYIDSPDGKKLPMAALITEYRDMQNEEFETATQRFLDKYGENAFLLMQNKSITVSPGIPAPTEEANDWIRENPWAMKEFPITYGFFAPQGGAVSGDTYQRQLRAKNRAPMSVEQYLRAGNDLIAQSIYWTEREKLLDQAKSVGRKSLAPNQQQYMRELDEWLRTNYEGYGDVAGTVNRAEPEELIDELSRAIKHPKLSDTETGKSVAEYLKLRDRVKAQSLADFGNENSFQSHGDAVHLRAALVEFADELGEYDPTFQPIWDRVFRDEIIRGLRTDDTGQEVTGG